MDCRSFWNCMLNFPRGLNTWVHVNLVFISSFTTYFFIDIVFCMYTSFILVMPDTFLFDISHTELYWFQMPLKEDVSVFVMFWSTHFFKNGKIRMTSHDAIGDSQLIFEANLNPQIRIWLNWLHMLAGYIQGHPRVSFFSFPKSAHMSRPKYQEIKDIFFKRY